jgi:hypothetical protein
MARNEAFRWAVIAVILGLTVILSVADIVLTGYETPSEFYPFAGLVIGAMLARLGGVREIEDDPDD